MEVENINSLKGLITKANRVMGRHSPKSKLSEYAFCSKLNMFPVPDCDHIAVARAYLGKSKFTKEAKEKIADCINKRSDELGCTSNTKITASRKYPIYIELSYKQKQLYSSEVFRVTRNLVEDSIINPGKKLNSIDIIL